MYEYTFTEIPRAVDGDTLDAKIDLGFHVHIACKLRLQGINTPELPTPEGKQARAFVAQWFAKHFDQGVTVKTIRDREEKYGRMLAIIARADGTTLNNELIAAGLAVPYMADR